MWKSGRNIIAAVLVAVVGSMVGCNSLAGLLPDSIDIPFDLESSNIGRFSVTEGEPESKLATFSVDSAGITPASGTLSFDPESITITMDESSEKGIESAQQTIACVDTCLAGGGSDTICQNVCDNDVIEVSIHFREESAVNEDCNVGDEYRVTITLDGDTVSGVEVTPSELSESTIDVMSSGAFSACFNVIAPFTGEVLLSEMVISVSP